MKNNIYKFYEQKYKLNKLPIKVSNAKMLFLIYDEKYNYYLKNSEFIFENNNIDILGKIKELNEKYKLEITNFYPVCYCDKTLIMALKTEIVNTTLDKVSFDNMVPKYKDILLYHKENYFTLFVSSNIKKEISMSQKYINRYKFHERILKKYIFTEKKRCKKEFRDILSSLVPNKNSIIDISCGDNSDIFVIAKKKNYKTIVGNDICLNYLNLAKEDNILYTNDNIESNDIKEGAYDVSFCKNTLHHMNNLTNIKNALDFMKKISNEIIIIEIMDPKEYNGIPKILNKYLYSKFLKDVGNCYLNEAQFINIINTVFKNHKIQYKTFVNILGTYKVAKITKGSR